MNKKKIILFFLTLFISILFFDSSSNISKNIVKEKIKKVSEIEKNVFYSTHIQNIGWQEYRKNGELSGTTGQSKRLEGLSIKLDEGGIEYKTHIEDIGWEGEYKKDGEVSGTVGQSKRLEAVEIRLYGDIKEEYDIYYRVHAQEFGWLGWAKNGQKAGTAGYSYRLEAIEIKLVKKTEEFENIEKSFYKKEITYNSHVSNIGWTNNKTDGESGQRGFGIEALKVNLINNEFDGDVLYKSYVDGTGWEKDYKKNGEVSGTTGKSKNITAINIKLSGQMEEKYDIYYKVYSEKIGYLGWAKNGEDAGSNNYKIELIEIKLILKGEDGPKKEGESFFKPNLKYQSHIQDIGWQESKYDGSLSGTTGKSKRIEAFTLSLLNDKYEGSVEYKSLIQNEGWEEYKQNGQNSGSIGKSKRIEAIQIRLTGDIGNYYDIYYRVHIQDLGWMGWAKNGEKSGTSGYDKRIEAIEIKLVDKKDSIETNIPSFYERKISYKSHVSDIGWMDNKYDGEASGIVGLSKGIEAVNIKLLGYENKGDLQYKSYIHGFGWERDFKTGGNISGTTGVSKNIEAVQIKLTGEIENYYDIYYRTHIQDIGWMGWAKNGQMAGSSGFDKKLEALEIKLIKKDEEKPDSNTDAYIQSIEGYYIISNNQNNKSLDIDGLIKSGSNIFFNEKNELLSQIWKIKDYIGGYSYILSSNPKLALTNENGQIKLKKYSKYENQMWTVKDLGNGEYNIISKTDGKYLDSNDLKLKENTNYKDFILDRHLGVKTYRGIDISKWQGNIKFSELIDEKIDFIIMRVGTGRDNYEKDSRFDEYYEKANYYDIPVGAYTYSYALNITEALKEANLTIKWLDRKQLDLPVFYDIENVNQTLLGKDVLTKIAETFCDKIIENGYKCGIYANKYFLKDNLDAEELSKKYPIWLAHWTGSNNYAEALDKKYDTDYTLTPFNYWQFSSLGVFKGIEENTVDLDFGYDIFD